MPLYDVSYRRFFGPRTSRRARVAALARSGVELLMRRRGFWLLLALSWTPALVRGGQIYIAQQIPETGAWAARWLEVSPSLWKSFLTQQISPLAVLMALYAGAGAIANDLARGGLAIYLSKPISRSDYFLGKAIPIGGSILAMTLLPALSLLGFHLGVAEDWKLLRQSPWLPLAIVAYSVILSGHLTFALLAVSSVGRSHRLAAAGFVMLLLGSHVAWGALSRMTGGTLPPYLSLVGSAQHTADLFFGGTSAYAGSPLLSFVSMALVMASSAYVVNRRLSSTEVVA